MEPIIKAEKKYVHELFDAAGSGDVGEVKRLIELGADVNVQGNGDNNSSKQQTADWTALHYAAFHDYMDVTAFLLLANCAKANPDCITPLHFAVRRGHKDVAAILIEKGADVNAKEKWGITPLHDAVTKGYTDLAALLIEKGADVNARDIDGKTPLHNAASNGHVETTVLLLEMGAKNNAKANDGTSALYLAASKGHNEVEDLIKEHGASLTNWERFTLIFNKS